MTSHSDYDTIQEPVELYTMITKQIAIALTLATISTFVVLSSVHAEECVTQYGGSQYGTTCNPNDLVINKEVQKIGSTDGNGSPVYVENLSVSDAHVIAGTYMNFRLTIKNNSSETINSVEVKDIFPPYMSYVSGGPSGTVYDAETRTMVFTLKDLKDGEARTITYTAKVDEEKYFPSGKSSFCVVNTARVKSEKRSDEDTAQVCIKTPDVKGITTLPKAGFNDLALIVPFALLGVFGLKLALKKN